MSARSSAGNGARGCRSTDNSTTSSARSTRSGPSWTRGGRPVPADCTRGTAIPRAVLMRRWRRCARHPSMWTRCPVPRLSIRAWRWGRHAATGVRGRRHRARRLAVLTPARDGAERVAARHQVDRRLAARESLGRRREDFAGGLTEELTARLAQLKTLRVVSRTSAISLQMRHVSVSTIAREFDVDAVLEGSVRRENGRVRISIQLIHAPTDTHLWARDFEREATATWPLQIEVAQAVADEIRVRATPEERARLAAVPRITPAAHEVPARAPPLMEVHRRRSRARHRAFQSSHWSGSRRTPRHTLPSRTPGGCEGCSVR